MELEFVLLADAVENVNGKLYVLGGGWREFRSPRFPTMAQIGIAVSLLLTPDEAQRPHQVNISYSEKGRDLSVPQPHPPGTGAIDLNIQAQIAPIPAPRPGPPQRSIVAINGTFPVMRPVIYEIKVEVDAQERKSTCFMAVTAAPTVIMN
jgi:hypothetical protein